MSNAATASQYASTDAELERDAYNAAFYALGLRWYWDIDTYNWLRAIPVASERIRVYLQTRQPHLLTAYDADFLVSAIETKKALCRKTQRGAGQGGSRHFDWAEAGACELGA
jgi:hypothetical protein